MAVQSPSALFLFIHWLINAPLTWLFPPATAITPSDSSESRLLPIGVGIGVLLVVVAVAVCVITRWARRWGLSRSAHAHCNINCTGRLFGPPGIRSHRDKARMSSPRRTQWYPERRRREENMDCKINPEKNRSYLFCDLSLVVFPLVKRNNCLCGCTEGIFYKTKQLKKNLNQMWMWIPWQRCLSSICCTKAACLWWWGVEEEDGTHSSNDPIKRHHPMLLLGHFFVGLSTECDKTPPDTDQNLRRSGGGWKPGGQWLQHQDVRRGH